MFVRSAFVALFLISALFSVDVEAQLFRFGRNYDAGRFNYPQPQRSATAYDASAYRYTQPQQTANYIPSQRQSTCQCAPSPNQRNQQQLANQTARTPQQQNQIVVVNYRDPYTGRMMQRQYLVQRTTTPRQQQRQRQQRAFQRPVPTGVAQSVMASAAVPQTQPSSPAINLSQTKPPGLASPIMVEPNAEGIRQTSFESPALVPQDSNGQFSVLEANGTSEGQPAAAPVVDSSLPVLELPGPTDSDPGALEIETSSTIDIDLPALTPGK